jgi:hypothetical protein
MSFQGLSNGTKLMHIQSGGTVPSNDNKNRVASLFFLVFTGKTVRAIFWQLYHRQCSVGGEVLLCCCLLLLACINQLFAPSPVICMKNCCVARC